MPKKELAEVIPIESRLEGAEIEAIEAAFESLRMAVLRVYQRRSGSISAEGLGETVGDTVFERNPDIGQRIAEVISPVVHSLEDSGELERDDEAAIWEWSGGGMHIIDGPYYRTVEE